MCIQVKLIGNTVCMVFNGGWTFPGVNYILKRVNTEVTTHDTDPESELHVDSGQQYSKHAISEVFFLFFFIFE